MELNTLLQSASSLKPVSKTAAEEYAQKAELMVATINSVLLSREDINRLVGVENLSAMQLNHANHAKFISSILSNYNPKVFVETILWVFKSYRSRGFHVNYWPVLLKTWIHIINQRLSPEAAVEIIAYYEWMLENVANFEQLTNYD